MQEKRKKRKKEKKRETKGKTKDPALTQKKREKIKSLVENSKRLTNKKNRAVKKIILGNYCYFTIIEGKELSIILDLFLKKLLLSPTLLIASCVQTNIRLNPKVSINLIWMDGWMDGRFDG